MLPEHLIFIDLETTGTNSRHERITEIGLCEVVNGEPGEEWSSLVNPEKRLSSFIEGLTGITNGMVADAPRFAELAGDLLERCRSKILVAHNARFDIGFLKSEFRRLGIDFQAQFLCTLKLSRALFPGHRRHNLDELAVRHGLDVTDRHRALGDARLIRQFFLETCIALPGVALEEAIRKQLKAPALPPYLPAGQIADLPAGPGVYLFYGERDALLYVGKSVDIRSRVKSHFAGDHRLHKGMRLSQQVRRIEFIETAGELGALLLEARLVKERAPIHNRRLRRTRDLFAIRLVTGAGPAAKAEIAVLGRLDGVDFDHLYGLYRSRRQAETGLREIVREQGLCNRVLGLEKGSGACFGYQIRHCRGACVGEEPLALHQARLINALADLKIRSWPFPGVVGIRERSPDADRTEIHLFDRWCHLGSVDSDDKLRQALAAPAPLPFDLDSYKILTRFLDKSPKDIDLMDLSRSSA